MGAHPGAPVPVRAWAPARIAGLVDFLAGLGYNVVVTGAEHERKLTARGLATGGPRT